MSSTVRPSEPCRARTAVSKPSQTLSSLTPDITDSLTFPSAKRQTAPRSRIAFSVIRRRQRDRSTDMEDTELLDGLRRISTDLDDRWNGAAFSLNQQNPDAARHFCTSAREILTQIFQLKAPDADVVTLLPDCDRTSAGNPTRRSKIRYLLARRDMAAESFEQFVEDDIENIVQLFDVFNKGTHGAAGTFDLPQLVAVKKRVKNGIMFLTEIIGDA